MITDSLFLHTREVISISSLQEKTNREGSDAFSGQSVLTPIYHLHLNRYGKREVREFLKVREYNLLLIYDGAKSGLKIAPVSLKSSIDI